MTDTGEVIEFCDPRIQSKQTIEEIFDIDITNHSYIYTELRKNQYQILKFKKKTTFRRFNQ
jgi:Fur family ferric uptake transcriptional regulator